MTTECDYCGKEISNEQADYTYTNYHNCLCSKCADYVNIHYQMICKHAL